MHEATAIIVAGGRSRRMGTDKGSLPWNGWTLLDATIDVARQVADEVLVVAAAHRELGTTDARCVVDEHADIGPVGGLHAGLRAASHRTCIVTPCDAPFLTVALLGELLGLLGDHLAVVPVVDGREQPLCAAWSVDALDTLETYIAQGGRSLGGLLRELPDVHRVATCDLHCAQDVPLAFTNVNTPDAYRTARDAHQHSR